MKPMVSRVVIWLSCLVLIIAAALVVPGCGVSSASPNTVQVWGRVTHNGFPLQKGVVIVFEPTVQSNNNWGVGMIEENGKFKLTSAVVDTPLARGRYQVFFKPPSTEDVRRHKHRKANEEMETDEHSFDMLVFSLVPGRFLAPQTSGLTVELEDEPTRVDIDFKD